MLVSYKASFFVAGGGKLLLGCKPKFGLIHVGFYQVELCSPSDKTKIIVRGTLIFKGRCYLGNGTKIRIYENALMVLGDKFSVSSSSSFNCSCNMTFGDNVLYGWDCLTMDTDSHKIFNQQGEFCNEGKPIVIGENVWIGSRSTILKGTTVPGNCVIGATSLVTGSGFKENTVILGSPAKSVKAISGWKL